MVKPGLRGKAHKPVKTPGGRLIRRPVESNRRKAKCAWCHQELHGTPALPRAKMKRLAKSSRRPERPYGGYICSRCLKSGLIRAIIKGTSPG